MTAQPTDAGAGGVEDVNLRLYVAGGSPTSRRADANLRAAIVGFGRDLPCEVVDVLADSRRAMSDNVIVTPTLVGSAGGRRLVMIGDLADGAKLSSFLRNLIQTG